MGRYRYRVSLAAVMALIAGQSPILARAAEPACFGTPAHGAVTGAVPLPLAGPNFEAYTEHGARLSRTHVHPTVAAITVEAYRRLEATAPGVRFVYGETGLPDGGPFPPHRTNQNGASVDYIVPLRGRDGRRAMLPRALQNKYGYEVELDAQGRLGDLDLDVVAIAEHLYQLRQAASKHGLALQRVILDPPLARRVLATSRGQSLRDLPWVWGKVWVRHDDHNHVDFALKCKPMPIPPKPSRN